MNEKKKVFYGWYILAASILTMAVCYAPMVNCTSLFVTPITTELGFARGAYTLTKTMCSVAGMIVAPYIGKIMSKKHMHKVWLVCIIGAAGAYSAFSLASTLPQFYVLSFIQGLFLMGATMLPVNIVITNWFRKKRGLMISIALAGSGLGGTIFSKVIGTLLVSHGWRYTYRVIGIFVICILLPLVGLIVRRRPEEKGMVPYGAGERAEQSSKKIQKEWNISLKELRSRPLFWAYVAGCTLISFTGAVIVHIPAAVTDAGYSTELASTIVSIYLFIAIPGKMILGYIFDKFGVKAGILFGNIAFFGTMVALLFVSSLPMVYVMAVLFGFGTCIATVDASVIASKLFGTKYYGEIYGFTTTFTNAGYAVGAPVIGLVYDVAGSYAAAWVLFAVIAVVMTVLLLYSVNASKKEARLGAETN